VPLTEPSLLHPFLICNQPSDNKFLCVYNKLHVLGHFSRTTSRNLGRGVTFASHTPKRACAINPHYRAKVKKERKVIRRLDTVANFLNFCLTDGNVTTCRWFVYRRAGTSNMGQWGYVSCYDMLCVMLCIMLWQVVSCYVSCYDMLLVLSWHVMCHVMTCYVRPSKSNFSVLVMRVGQKQWGEVRWAFVPRTATVAKKAEWEAWK
jgi:hypothetical protein